MTKFLRFIYRIFFKNRIARLAIFLTLSVFGVKWATENLLGKKKTLFVKTILAINPSDINTFTIRQRDEELTFTRGTTDWLAVKNDVTVKIPEDSIVEFLNLFGKMEAVALKKMPEVDANVGDSGSIENERVALLLKAKSTVINDFSMLPESPTLASTSGIFFNATASILPKRFKNAVIESSGILTVTSFLTASQSVAPRVKVNSSSR